MHSVRSAKRYYFAAFLFGVIIALLIAAPVRADTFHLDRATPGNSALNSEPNGILNPERAKIAEN
jgi:hypothetical protein